MAEFKKNGVISIHAPTRGATITQSQRTTRSKFQSTLLQEERPFSFFVNFATVFISIHAPTRGATLNDKSGRRIFEFQSTLLQEERRCSTGRKADVEKYFNPRSYKRSDVERSPGADDGRPISIHAPTRGATLQFLSFSLLYKDFNPRSYKRSDNK